MSTLACVPSTLDLLHARRALGHRLRDARIEADLTLDQAAATTGVAPQYISECERGNKMPSLPTLLDLAATYRVLPAELLVDYPFGKRRRPPRPPAPPPDGRRR